MPSFASTLTVFTLFCGSVFAQDATAVTNNPAGVSYGATLPDLTTTNIRGSVVAQSDPSGTGVLFQVTLAGFPAEGGPFLYHIHANPIVDGNCSTAGGHLDPFNRGDSPACDASEPSTCQVGDLSGKHGKINGTTFSAK
jgi:Cu/Zn superoxide dismutase